MDVRRKDGRTAYALGMQTGQKETAALLRARGANTELSEVDALVAAWSDGDESLRRTTSDAIREAMRSSENAKLLPDLAENHATASVRALLDAGAPIDARGHMGETALHWACWKGYADLANLLVDRGASLAVQDSQYHATPPGWFGHGIRNSGERGDYAGVARALVEAHAKFSDADIPTGHEDVDAVLREAGAIAAMEGRASLFVSGDDFAVDDFQIGHVGGEFEFFAILGIFENVAHRGLQSGRRQW